jgi:hypothetical protein
MRNYNIVSLFGFILLWSLCAYLVFALMGCSPILRHNRLVKKYPYVHTADTLVLRDTITFKEVHHDSSFYYNQKDTVRIEKGNMEIKYFYSNDTVHIDGRCKEVKTIIERKVPMYKNNTDYVALLKRWFWWIFGIVALLIGIRLVIKLYFKK